MNEIEKKEADNAILLTIKQQYMKQEQEKLYNLNFELMIRLHVPNAGNS